MANVYWCDTDSSVIYCWDGTTLTTTTISPWEELGNLIAGPNNKLLVTKWDANGAFQFQLDLPGLNNRVNWPEQQTNGVTVRRNDWYNAGVYDPTNDVYWILLDPTMFTEPSTGLANPVLGKYSTSGTLLSVHCDNPQDFDLISNQQLAGQAWLHDGWLYWNGDKIITRYQTSTDTWQWCWARPAGSAYVSGQRRAVLGVTPSNQLLCHWYDTTNFDDYIELYDLSGFTWTTFPNPATFATETGGVGMPAWSTRWRIDDNPAGHIAASSSLVGWAAYDGANTLYFGALSGAQQVLDSIDLTTGTVSTHVNYNTASADASGMVVIATQSPGQLYVNLSTTQNAPNWVSVCPSSSVVEHVGGLEDYYNNSYVPSHSIYVGDETTMLTDGSDSTYFHTSRRTGTSAGYVWVNGQLQGSGFDPASVTGITVHIRHSGTSTYTGFDGHRFGFGLIDAVGRGVWNTKTWYASLLPSPESPLDGSVVNTSQSLTLDSGYTAGGGSWAGLAQKLLNGEVWFDVQSLTQGSVSGTYYFENLIYELSFTITGSGGSLGHFNLSNVSGSPTWQQIHYYSTGGWKPYWANAAVTGDPDWRPCCSHAP